MSGWIYAVYHDLSPIADDGARRIKFGKSKFDPECDSLEGRVRKLDLSVIALGLGPVAHAVKPFRVLDHSAFERELKDRLKRAGKMVKKSAKRQLTEVCEMPISDFAALIEEIKVEFGV